MENKKYLSVEECRQGFLYEIQARNFNLGIYDESQRGFVGIRKKGGTEFLFCEYHWDTNEKFGTAKPLKEIEPCPINLENWIQTAYEKTELFKWLKQKSTS